jgi:hypothetical protein
MKPIKNLEPMAKWILRFALLAFVVSFYFYDLKTFNFKDVFYLINLIYVSFCLLLFIGGFQKNASLTIVSAMFVSLISFYKSYLVFSGELLNSSFYSFVMLAAIGLFFTSKGNS